MGSAASVGLAASLGAATEHELGFFIGGLSVEQRGRILTILTSSTESARQADTSTPNSGPDLHVGSLADAASKQILGPDLTILGSAPPAIRPKWLPTAGPGQANVDPMLWGLSIEQWIFFIRACLASETWKALVEAKSEYTVTMYDVKDHFVVPWTSGTGCSISLLLNSTSPKRVELMLSHAWGGSVLEVYNCLQNLVNHHDVPSTAVIFYCTLSMYQPEDGAASGLTIQEQLDRKPFAKIIESRPVHGMRVLHTHIFEVYSRMWTVHEVDEAMLAHIELKGLFDMYRWRVDEWDAIMSVDTENSDCRPEDRLFLSQLILARGGFTRLDEKIVDLRKKMKGQLADFLEKTMSYDDDVGKEERENYFHGDWWKGCAQVDRDDDVSVRVEWKFHKAWKAAMRRVASDYKGKIIPYSILDAYPVGKDAFPFGEAREKISIAPPEEPDGWDI